MYRNGRVNFLQRYLNVNVLDIVLINHRILNLMNLIAHTNIVWWVRGERSPRIVVVRLQTVCCQSLYLWHANIPLCAKRGMREGQGMLVLLVDEGIWQRQGMWREWSTRARSWEWGGWQRASTILAYQRCGRYRNTSRTTL